MIKPKPCPFCGADLGPGKVNLAAVLDLPLLETFEHPHNDCILAGRHVRVEHADMWNRRAAETAAGSVTAKTPSRGDQIRAMTDEELMDACNHYIIRIPYPMINNCRGRKYIRAKRCRERWLKWLKEEAKE